MYKGILMSLLLLVVTYSYAQQLAFPGAEGFGKYTTGGRGGRVVEVTTLKDLSRTGQAEPGSLRAALNTPGDDPITIVFRVSGIIELGAELRANRSNMTIAGQTAPGDGICIKNYTVNLGGSKNVIIRYIRFRPGDQGGTEVSALRLENSENIIIDHCSMSWSIEETMGFYDNKNTTIQWCILSEGLYESIHKKGTRGYAAQWGGQFASYHHNLLAHNYSRSPRINGSRAHDTLAIVDFRNNVVFNWGRSGAVYGGELEIEGGVCRTNFVNNYYKKGPATQGNYFAEPSYESLPDNAKGYGEWYFAGNIMEGNPNGVNDNNWLGVNTSKVGGEQNIRSDEEFEVEPIPTETAAEAYASVLAGAGAVLPVRDAVDTRIIQEVKGEIDVSGNGIIDSQTEVGGWPEYQVLEPLPDTDGDGMPDEYETENGLNPEDAEDGKAVQSNGYTNLEIYLNSIVGVHGSDGSDANPLSSGELPRAFNVYPNPGQDRIYFSFDKRIVQVQLFDMQGKLLKTKPVFDAKENYLQVDSLQRGVYMLKVTMSNGTVIERKVGKK